MFFFLFKEIEEKSIEFRNTYGHFLTPEFLMTAPKVYEGDREQWLACIQANRKLLAHADWMDAESMTAKALSDIIFSLWSGI